jgi:hypothetical protein
MQKALTTAAIALAAVTTLGAQAQTPPAGGTPQQPPAPVTLDVTLKRQHQSIRGFLLKSAEVMPEEHYTFEATPAQRTYAEFIGHIANANYGQCSVMAGEPNPMAPAGGTRRNLETEAPKLSKADLVKLFGDALAICDRAYEKITADNVLTMVQQGQRQSALASLAVANLTHNQETYGTMVVYLRLKGITPPSSEPR